ncbi:MAG: sodium:solute symporter family protein [Synergistaceae bacterium]|nr:sodium:solute symporter family protein [Synergistaceae bacterium]
MSPLIYYLLAFGAYTICIIMMTGQSFAWKETRLSFYLGGRKFSAFPTTATFCATWMSPLSLVGYSMWLYSDGYVAFLASVNGWILGLLFFPFIVQRLRMKRVLSLPEWLEKTYGDTRVRKLVAVTMIFLYTLYLVIQFRAFGVIVSYMLDIPSGFASTSLIYLFVLYTTFGGYISVVRSDVINLLLIILGVTVAAAFSLPSGFSFKTAAGVLLMKGQLETVKTLSYAEIFSVFAVMLSWGLGVAGNPQYAVRILACRSEKDAYKTIAVTPFIVGWIYVCVTFFILVCRSHYPIINDLEETLSFARLGQFLPSFASASLLIGVIAAAVSTANSQLLLAACSLCYDLFPIKMEEDKKENLVYYEDRFLVINRIAITLIASAALLLSHAGLPGYLMLGRISWTLVAICFFIPLFIPSWIIKDKLFFVLSTALSVQCFLVFAADISPENAMLAVLILEALLFKIFRYSAAYRGREKPEEKTGERGYV